VKLTCTIDKFEFTSDGRYGQWVEVFRADGSGLNYTKPPNPSYPCGDFRFYPSERVADEEGDSPCAIVHVRLWCPTVEIVSFPWVEYSGYARELAAVPVMERG